jgi:hypothetical protein
MRRGDIHKKTRGKKGSKLDLPGDPTGAIIALDDQLRNKFFHSLVTAAFTLVILAGRTLSGPRERDQEW